MKHHSSRLAGFLALLLLPLASVAQDEKAAAKTSGPELPDPVAVVEGEKISRADLQEAFNSALASSGMNPDDIDPAQKMAGYREILDELIVDKLVSRKASSVEIKDADLEAEVTRVKSQFPSEDVFKAEMEKAGETESSFRDTVKRMLQQQKWMQEQIGDKASVAEDEVKKFYETNKKEFEHPELVRASHILILTPEEADEKTVAEKKKAAEAALERVTAKKEDFTAVAKEVSEEPGAKESGGDLNFFPKERMVPEFADAAFGLGKGEISKEPVRTKFGWHVIKVTDRKPAGTMPFDEVKQQVGAYLEGTKRRDAVRSVIDGLRSDAKVENKLPEASKPAAAPTES
ncbi:MAG: peptidylprolyl isomerase [Chthoniobacterales bacterium]|jgi:peptidyl-prolyl cis-trans isomerase C